VSDSGNKERLAQAIRDGDTETFTAATRRANTHGLCGWTGDLGWYGMRRRSTGVAAPCALPDWHEGFHEPRPGLQPEDMAWDDAEALGQ
jgi:hypothetical protein